MTALRSGSATDIGKVRANNQDQLLDSAPLFAVADGMGGHAAGEVASLTAVEALRAAFARDATAEGLVSATEDANRSVWDRAAADAELRGMGTTMVALALVHEDGEDRLAIVNVGDSRVYLLRGGELEQLTTDHRLVQELVDDGQLSEAEAIVHPQRNVLTRALGVDRDVEVDTLQVLPFKGDRFLLCSDGLSGEVSDAQIASLLRRFADPGQAARELVAEARAHGGTDNITVVVVDVVDDDDKAAEASAALADDPGLVIPSELGKDAPDAADQPGGRPRRRGWSLRRARVNGEGGPSRSRAWSLRRAREDSEGGPSRLGGRAGRRGRVESPAGPRARLVTMRVVGFFVLLIVLLGGAVAAVAWYARGSYYVGIEQTELTIFKGRPGGLLWFKPTVARRTGVPTDAVLASRLDDLRSGKEEGSLGEATRYVANLQAEAQAHRAATTSLGTPPAATGTTATTTSAPAAGG